MAIRENILNTPVVRRVKSYLEYKILYMLKEGDAESQDEFLKYCFPHEYVEKYKKEYIEIFRTVKRDFAQEIKREEPFFKDDDE